MCKFVYSQNVLADNLQQIGGLVVQGSVFKEIDIFNFHLHACNSLILKAFCAKLYQFVPDVRGSILRSSVLWEMGEQHPAIVVVPVPSRNVFFRFRQLEGKAFEE